MYTEGTANDKRVDIADDYTLHANGDAAVGGNLTVGGTVSITGSAAFGGNVAVGSGNLLKIVSKEKSYSCSANSSVTVESFGVNPGTGWTQLCIAGFASGNGSVLIRAADMKGSGGARLVMRNVSSSAVSSVTATVYVLCVRTSL